MAEPDPKSPLLIKRYASRRLYNTETSDYVTLEDIAGFIRSGRQVKIVDLKSGDDLTRQYLLQIIAEHEGRGENVLPIDVLTDLVRSYTTQAQSVVPQFLAASFEMLREGQSKMMENLATFPNPMSSMPGFEALQRQQRLFLKAMAAGWGAAGSSGPEAEDDDATNPRRARKGEEDMDEIRKQLAELQKRISRL
ncbi:MULTISPECIES: polyhydroxyalkanoate synthesis repressor PhaR [Paracoccus]|uniref:Polyhydroxyalkanoate synthesis repressor PhaR n=2 Tax=Paracoccus TaxID=265 RepID=A0A5P2QV04_9RHOB|nr:MULTISPECIES: polyhydroxyalkanoate synthesis repressor PhaR [Paracoccus]AWX92620.1 polyhydroxyalkanoate synthesis repressor PhaR [Paracoccus mutanolyticus]MBY0137486.1 polyhydroxyalkanoate synthesis repressor PhaR [Paracoccus yeei]QEU09785.1 polyhydroxyalkanoate synthesis repressor PhaR [Paracoccus yeei]